MKKNTLLLITFLVILGSIRTAAQNRYWIAASTSNWNNTANWSASSGGPGGASVPGPAETVNFNGAGPGNCNLDVPPTVNGINVNGYTGTIDLLGNNLTTTGTNTFTTGTISNSGGAASVTLNTTNNSTFNGTLFNANLSGTTGRLFLNGSTFNGTLDLTKTTNTTDTNTGGNTFNSTVSITNSSTSSIQLGNTNPDIFNGTVTLTTNSTGDILPARTSTGNQFNGNILLNYNSAAGHILFGSNSGTSTLADGFTISINSFGVSGCANLQLAYFTQLGNTPQSIILAGNSTATLTLGPSSIFNGSIVATTPVLVFNSSTFNNTGDFTQTSTTNTGNSRGGNVFHGAVTMTNTGDGDLILGANGADAGDTFNGAATFNDLGGGRIRVGASTPGNVFNADATFNSSGSTNSANRIQISRFSGASTTFNGTTRITNNGNSSDIHVCYDPGSLATFNGPLILTSNTSASGDFEMGRSGDVVINGNLELNSTCTDNIQLSAGSGSVTFGNGTISIGASGFSQGQLTFLNFTQTGTTAISLNLTGARINLGSNSSFGGNVSFIASRMFLNGTTYNGTAYLEKNGSNDDAGIGNNVFQNTAEIVNSGSGYLMSANAGADTFNGALTLSNTGTNLIYMAHNSPGNAFNENIIVNSISGSGIYFSNAANGTSTLAATRTISVGALGFSEGDLRLLRFTQVGATPQILTFTGNAELRIGPSAQFDGNVSFTSPGIFLNGCTYNGTASFIQNGSSAATGTGNNIFNGTTSITSSGSGIFRTNGNNTFNGTTTITNNASNDILLELTSPSTYNNTVTFTNTGNSSIRVAYAGANSFNGDIFVNSTSGSGITFSEQGTATSTLAPTYAISVGGTGFTAGTLNLNRFTQLGGVPQVLTLSGNAVLNVGPASQFDGSVSFTSPSLLLNGCTYNGTATFIQNGNTNSTGSGNNVFNGTTAITNSGSGVLRTNGNNIFNAVTTITNSGSNDILLELTTPSTYNNTVIFTNSGTSSVRVAYAGANNFNGNIIVTSTSGSGILFSEQVAASSTLAATYSISIGGPGFSAGTLNLNRFTQLGATPQSLSLTGNATLNLGPSSRFDGNVLFIAPRVLLNGTTFNGTAYIEKNGIGDDAGSGNNIFNSTASIINSGGGYLMSANSGADTFNGNLTLSNTGSNLIHMAYNAPGNMFNGNITVNSISGTGIYFSNGSNGTGTLAATRTISIGGLGFTSGDLRLLRFTQLGATAQSLTFAGSAGIRIGPSSRFDGNVSFIAPRVFLNGATYNGTAYFEKTGTSPDDSAGGNIFNQQTTIINSGDAEFRHGVSSLDTYNGNLILRNSGSSLLSMSRNVSGNLYNGNIQVNSTSGLGIYFGESNGTSTLAAARTITVGGSGFSAGDLRLRYFTQNGGTPQAITLTGAALLRVGPSSQFNGNVTFIAPQVMLQGCTYNGTAFIEKNGANANDSYGNNIFNGTTTIVNSGSARLRLSNDNSAGNNGDQFNGDVTFRRTGTGTLDLAYNQTSYFRGNIITNDAITGITFGASTGVAQFNGTNPQSISKSAGLSPIFRRLEMNKASGNLTLNTDASISVDANFIVGVINTTATNFLNVLDNATTTGMNNTSYVNGPVRKTGNDPYTFPVGSGGFYRPISISNPSNTTHHFTAQYFRTAQPFGGNSTWDPGFYTVSGCEYWTLDRTNGTSNVTVTLSWNESACDVGYITNPVDLRVTRWTGAAWADLGNGGTTGTATNGTITTSSAVTAFSPFTLASTTSLNPLPVELAYFRGKVVDGVANLEWRTLSELNNDYFTLERSSTGIDFETLAKIPGHLTSEGVHDYAYYDEAPYRGRSYYRLKQTDLDGTSKYLSIVTIYIESSEVQFFVYPNPASKEPVHLNQKSNITIYNNLQQPVLKAEGIETFDPSSLPAGVYIIYNQKGEMTRLVIY